MEPMKVFWKKKYMIKNSPQWEISGYSRSGYRTGFYVNGLNILLDAGPQCFKKPEHIFITHSHGDHIANLPFTLIREEDGNHVYNIYCPKKASGKIKKYISSMFEANAICDDIPVDEWFNLFEIDDDNKNLDVKANKQNLQVEIIKCNHRIPTVSYGFALKKKKLNPKYSNLTGREIGALRKKGTDVSIEVIDKIFCYICDTTIKVLDDNPFILDYKTVFIECTFIYDGEEEKAINKSHIHWQQLKPYVLNNPDINFMLFHFSLKYKDEEIKEFMEKEFKKDNINNIELWLSDLYK